MLSKTLFGLRTSVLFRCSTQKKKDSQWIYSSKYEQMKYQKKGKIFLYNHLTSDTHDTSLRLYEALMDAHMIVTSRTAFTQSYMQALIKHERYIHKEPEKTTLPDTQSQTSLQQLHNIINTHEQTPTRQFDSDIEISKYIQYRLDTEKDQPAGQRLSKKTIDEVKQYVERKLLQKKIEEVRSQVGYAPILQIDECEGKIIEWQKNGFNVVCVFGEEDIFLCGKTISQLEEASIGYEIIPSSDRLIESIVCSGIPADRFSLEYNPSNFGELLYRRKGIKMTTCIMIPSSEVQDLLAKVIQIYHKQHQVYIGTSPSFYGPVYQAIQHIHTNPLPSGQIPIILSPYIAQFNQHLQKELNIKSHIMGQMLSGKLNIIEMEQLDKKLLQMKRKDFVSEVNLDRMVGQLLIKIQDEELVKESLKKMFPNQTLSTIESYIERGKKYVPVDYFGLNSA